MRILLVEDDQGHIFECFYRSDQSRSKPGNGLGLNYAMSIIRSHGGNLPQRFNTMSQLKRFSDLFGDVQKGDVFIFYFLSNGDIRISYNAHIQGTIHGVKFQQALLAIWLGRQPVENTLKKELLQMVK